MSATLGDRLHACGLDPSIVLAHRIALHPSDADAGYQTTADLVRSNHALIYQRLQDGPTFGREALVAGLTQHGVHVRFAGLRRLTARRAGVAPGDIVYDPEIAHLLHNFISRAAAPTFYDAVDNDRGDAICGTIFLWPDDAGDTLPADDTRLLCLAETGS